MDDDARRDNWRYGAREERDEEYFEALAESAGWVMREGGVWIKRDVEGWLSACYSARAACEEEGLI